MISGQERRVGSGNENVRPRSAQSLVAVRKTDDEDAIRSLFICDSGLISSLNISASENRQLAADIRYLHENSIQINLSHKDPGRIKEDVHELLAATPMALKCVLSDENHRGMPSLYIKEGMEGQSPEVVYGSSRRDLIPHNDLAFAVNFVSEWQKNNKVWPSVYAYFQPPRAVPPELISGIHETPIADLRKRGDVCDLSAAGFKPYHGEGAPNKVTARIITIKAAQGDNKPVANAIEAQTRPGDVVLVDNGGHGAGAILGGIIGSLAAKARGIKGILIYGEVRDQAELRKLSIPVFGLGCTPTGPSKVGPGSVHCSLSMGNIPFKSGDIVKIDHDQIVVVPCDNAASILGSKEQKDDGQAARNALQTRGSEESVRFPKTFELKERTPSKNTGRPELPSFIPGLFEEFAPAQISDSASFLKPDRLWAAGSDVGLRLGSIPDGKTLAGEAVLSSGSEESILSALGQARKGAFLVVSGESAAELTAAVMEKAHEAGIKGIVINGKAIIDEGLRGKYDIPCFAREVGAAGGWVQGGSGRESEPVRQVVFDGGFKIKPEYVVMADVDGVAGFSPTKFEMLYRTGSKKSKQETAAEDKIKSSHPAEYMFPLPKGSIITDRYYEPFVHAVIDQVPFLPTSRGIAAMELPAKPAEVQVGHGHQWKKLGSDEALKGVPQRITTHGENPMTFTLKNKEGEIQEVEGVSGRALFDVALAVEHNQAIEVRGDGSIVKQ